MQLERLLYVFFAYCLLYLLESVKPKHIDQAIEALSFFEAAIFAELDAIR
jgi:hypothetical protein